MMHESNGIPAPPNTAKAHHDTWPFAVAGFLICLVAAGFAYLEPLTCQSDSASAALLHWCRAWSTTPIEVMLALSCLGLILGLITPTTPPASTTGRRLRAVTWVTASAGVIGELVLALSIPS